MPGPAPAFEHTPVDETRVRHLHHVAEWNEPRRPPPERGVHRNVQQHPRVVEPAELLAREQERLATLEQLLGTDPESERTEDERAMQIDLDAVVRVLVNAGLAEPRLEPRPWLGPLPHMSQASQQPARPLVVGRGNQQIHIGERPQAGLRIHRVRDGCPLQDGEPDAFGVERVRQAHELALHAQAPCHRATVLGEQRCRLHFVQLERTGRRALDRETRHAFEPDPREQPLPDELGTLRRLGPAVPPSKPNTATLRASVSTSCASSGIRVRPLLDDPETQEHLEAILRPGPGSHPPPSRAAAASRSTSSGKRRREVQALPDGGRAAGQLVDLLITRLRHEHVGADTPMQRIGGRPEPGAVPEPHSRTTFGAGLDPNAFRASNTSFACSATQSRSYALCGVSTRDQVGACDRDGS